MTLQTLKTQGQSNRAIARQLGLSESVVRCHLKRQAARSVDGRGKASLIKRNL